MAKGSVTEICCNKRIFSINMKEKLINVYKLDNNQDLEIYDLSRKISEDGWVVIALVRMPLEITGALFNDAAPPAVSIEELQKVLGGRATFEVKMERNFIQDKNKDKEFNDLLGSFLKTNRAYLSKKTFPAKYVLKEYMKKTKNAHRFCIK